MDWASSTFVALLMTGLTGTIFYLAGLICRRAIGYDVAFRRFLAYATLGSFLLPLVFTVLYLTRRITEMKITSDSNLFYNTPRMRDVGIALGCIWIGLFALLLIRKLYHRFRWSLVCRGNIPEEDEAVEGLFHEICEELQVKGKVALVRNDLIDTPCITYCHGYVVMLPFIRYTEKELQVIFCHELCHYLHRDLHLKTTGCIVVLLHAFNPAVYVLFRQINLMCEEACDAAASKKGEKMFTKQEYMAVILRSLIGDNRKNRYQLFALSDDKTNFERRVEYMSRTHKKGGLKKGAAVIAAAAFLMGSSMTALAAGDGLVEAYKDMADETSVKNTYDGIVGTNVDVSDEEALEVLCKAYNLDPSKVTIMEDDADPASLVRKITWIVPKGETYMSSGFVQEVGDNVCVTVQGTPESLNYQMGLKDPEDIMWYVEGFGKIHQDFTIGIKGRHYFFVTNLSEQADLDIEAAIVR